MFYHVCCYESKAIKKMNEDYEQMKAAGKLEKGHINEDKLPVEFMQVDLASLKSTMDFIEAFKASGRKLQVLLCNAGLAAVERGTYNHLQGISHACSNWINSFKPNNAIFNKVSDEITILINYQQKMHRDCATKCLHAV